MYHFVLGAGDPEMDEVQAIATAAQCSFEFARHAGSRVFPSNAYKADAVSMRATSTLVFVECAPVGGRPAGSIVIDHHNPGDPGFGQPPERYLEASSVGQVLALLGVKPDALQHLIAAADHCLGAAYHGRCPGIDPLSLREWRTRYRAKFQGRRCIDVRRDQNTAIIAVRDAPTVTLAGYTFADLRGRTVPELPEASAITGRGVVYSLFDRRSGRTKVGVLNGSKDGLAAWLDWARSPASGLRDAYGDPVRGFAGAYAD